MGMLKRLQSLRSDERGVAAIEMAFITSVFAVAVLNAVEVGRYAYIVMETNQATQAGAQAALVTCDTQHVPATTNCSALKQAVATAIQSTSLGTGVSLDGALSEGYYCLNASNALVYAGGVGSKPADCSAYGAASLQPVLYLKVRTKYAYAPMFPGLTIGKTFPTSIRKTSMMRML